MISYYLKTARDKELQVLDDYQLGAWVCVEHPTRAEISELTEKFQLNPGNMHDALDKDEMPRLDNDGDYNYIYTSYVHSIEEKESTTLPVLFVIGPKLFMTISHNNMSHLDEFREEKIEFVTTQHTELFLLLLGRISIQYEDFVSRISKHIQRIRSRLRSHNIAREDFVDFVVIEDDLNELLSVLKPMSAVLRRLSLGHYIPMQKKDRDILEDLLLNNEQTAEACLSNTKTIVNIREAYSTITSNELNRTMKILTVATVLMALPNVVFSMYGMNLGLPFAELPFGYFIVVGITFVVMVVTIIVAKVKKVF
ncbi:MAG TPA: magnesium transporter CorA family protein [Candidatus Saccharibacteria bacterium]|nr:magnesium transporter CorA family protein [Candidatus Saccharibacteria bacterium]